MLKLDTNKIGINQIFSEWVDGVIAYLLERQGEWVSSGDVWRAIKQVKSQGAITGLLTTLAEFDYIEGKYLGRKGTHKRYRINMEPETFEAIIIFDLVKGIREAFPDNELSKELENTVMGYAVDKHIEERISK